MRLLVSSVLALTCCAVGLRAQATRPDTAAATHAPAAAASGDDQAWSFAAWAYAYSVPHGRDFVQPTVTADRDWLHLEARYNYEDLDTGSLWAGYNLHGGEELAWAITPMVGGIFGATRGVAPGYRGSLGWRRFELYSEGEYVIDSGDKSDFAYTWSELTFAPVESFRFGVVIQRTRAYDTDLDVQRGLMLGVNLKRLNFTASIFNLDESPVVVVSAGLDF